MVKVNNTGKTTAYLPTIDNKRIAFKPGINEIEQEDLDSVIKVQGGKWGIHYSKYLVVCEDAVSDQDNSDDKVKDEDSIGENTKDDTEENTTEDGSSEIIDEKTVVELKEIIGGMDKDELSLTAETENEREGGPRKTVLEMIEKAMKKFDNNE